VAGRENRDNCVENEHQIGLALIMYARSNATGRFPSDLPTLIAAEELPPIIFVCPSTRDTPANRPSDLTAGRHLSYIYIGAGLTKDSPADAVALYEPLSNHDNTGSNVLFADGHVEFIPVRQAAQLAAMAQAGIRPIYWPPHPTTQPSTQP
jgi:prepilin-type processing-associated H-X9-DG protein